MIYAPKFPLRKRENGSFENMNEFVFSDIEDAIEEGIDRYIFYIILNEVRTESLEEENKLKITISYNLPDDVETQILEITLNIGETGSSSPVY